MQIYSFILELTVDEVLRRWPVTIHIFIKYRMLCAGCPMAVHFTLREALVHSDLEAIHHGLEFVALIQSLPNSGV